MSSISATIKLSIYNFIGVSVGLIIYDIIHGSFNVLHYIFALIGCILSGIILSVFYNKKKEGL
jgi:hypothetical protein